MPGDLTRPLLGLSEEQIESLRDTVEHFFHLAAVYDLTTGAAQNDLMNVEGTRRVVRYEHSGKVTVLADSYQGKKLNAPNDAVVHPEVTEMVVTHGEALARQTGLVDARGRPVRGLPPFQL